MHPSSSDEIHAEIQRGELERVLASDSFQRAPTLARLLRHLCEAACKGDLSALKEYSVGIEVFHRPVSYMPESDSIVRVEVNRLRHRLTDYYANEGASNPARIAVPTGQYHPVCVVVECGAKEKRKSAYSDFRAILKGIFRAHGAWLWAFVLVTLLAALFFASGKMHRAANGGDAVVLHEIPDPSIGPPGGDAVRILAGGVHGYLDRAGKFWQPDRMYAGGHAQSRDAGLIARTAEQTLYRTSRTGAFAYSIPLHREHYELRVYFAETEFCSAANSGSDEGSRLMNLRINGRPMLENFDIASDAGGCHSADVKVFFDVAPADDGKLHLEFYGTGASEATVSAIEVLPGMHGRIRAVRLLPRSSAYYSNDSKIWDPDNFYQGGQIYTSSSTKFAGADPELYRAERWGNFTYQIPVARGRYAIVLYFADHRLHAQDASSAAYSMEPRVFDVYCNGKLAIQRVDFAREPHAAEGFTRRIDDVVANAQEKIILGFVPVQGYASVSGIEVIPR